MVVTKLNIKMLKQLTLTLKQLRLLKKYSDNDTELEIDLIIKKIHNLVSAKSDDEIFEENKKIEREYIEGTENV